MRESVGKSSKSKSKSAAKSGPTTGPVAEKRAATAPTTARATRQETPPKGGSTGTGKPAKPARTTTKAAPPEKPAVEKSAGKAPARTGKSNSKPEPAVRTAAEKAGGVKPKAVKATRTGTGAAKSKGEAPAPTPGKAARPARSTPAPASQAPATPAPGRSTTGKAAVKAESKPAPRVGPAATPEEARPPKSKAASTTAGPSRPARPAQPARPRKGSDSRASKPLSEPVPVQPPTLTVEHAHRQPSAVALKVFEQAVKVFNRRQFEEAKVLLENLIARYPHEVEILARVNTYLHVCNQRLAHTQNLPRNAEELYDRGVFALNTGDFVLARSYFEKALRIKPDEPHIIYSLAATLVQLGEIEAGLDCLRRSIKLHPRFRTQALNDAEFTDLRENRQFLALLGLTSPFDRLEIKK
jgi:hypothetical protein